MTFKFSKRSRSKLQGVNPDLVKVMERAIEITPIDFGITEGLRTVERQKQLYEAGASKTMNSKHLRGDAVDVVAYVGGQVSWDWPLYDAIAVAVKQAANELDIDITWGGDWTTFKDGPHFELRKNR